MPPQPKDNDVVYSWVDESGQTHYSNYKVSDLSGPSATHNQTPVKKSANENTTAQYQLYPPKPIKLTTVNKGLGGIGTILFLLAIVIIFRMLRGRSGWKQKSSKKWSGRRSSSPSQAKNNKNGSYSSALRTSPEVSTQPDRSKYIPIPQPVICELEESSPKPSWNLGFIQRLDWREFEKLCARILQEKRYRAELGEIGPDGGVDIQIYKQDEPERLIGIAQCKRQSQPIKIDTVRAFRYVMTSKQVDKGFFFTSGTFYKQARQFCEEENIEVITGEELIIAIKKLSLETQTEILDTILATDYMSHICVNCGIKMVKRTNEKTNEKFWGCINYPRCTNKIGIRKRDQ
jgi:restriction system protein